MSEERSDPEGPYRPRGVEGHPHSGPEKPPEHVASDGSYS